MILLQLKKFIQSSGIVSLQQLSRHFNIAPDALLPMINVWQEKGLVKECHDEKACTSTCKGCQPTNRYFQYIPR